MAEEGIAIEGEAGESSLSPQIQEQKTEEKARKDGWKPLDEYKGDPADWVPAKEFLGRQKLFDKIHDLKNQLSRQAQRFEQDMTKIQSHFLKVQETEYKRAKADLESQLARAKADENIEAAVEIAGQIKEVEQSAKVAAQEAKQVRAGGPTPEFQEWQEQNKWFQQDAEMTADAIAIGTGYAAANPQKSQKEVLEHVTDRIKKIYSDKFKEEAKPNTKGNGKVPNENRVEGGGSRQVNTENTRKGKLSVGDLDEMEHEVMKTLIKRGALKDRAAKNKVTQEEQYLMDLAEAKAVKKAVRKG